MLSLNVVRSLVLRDDSDHHVNSFAAKAAGSLGLTRPRRWKSRKPLLTQGEDKEKAVSGAPCLVFVPTSETVSDQSRLTAIARDLGMEFCGDLVNNRLVFSWPGYSLKESVSLPFRLTDAAPRALTQFQKLGRGFFRVEKVPSSGAGFESRRGFRSGSLTFRLTGEVVDSVRDFCRVMAGAGWSLFKVKAVEEMFVFRKIDFKLRLQWDGFDPRPSPAFRARELRLPDMDFCDAPLEILEFLVLMTDDLFVIRHKSATNARPRNPKLKI